MPAKGDKVRSIFTNIAPKYNMFNAVSSLGTYKYWLFEVAKSVNGRPGEVMLDIAGGTGDVAFEVARMCPPSGIVLTDFTQSMLDVAAERVAKGANHGVDIIIEPADAMDLPFADNSFDIVTMAYGLRNFEDRVKSMEEVYRVLVPGGRFVALEFATPPNAAWASVYNLYLNNVVPVVGGVVTGDRSGFDYLRDSIKDFPVQPIISSELRNTGFTDVSYRNLTGGIVAIHKATK